LLGRCFYHLSHGSSPFVALQIAWIFVLLAWRTFFSVKSEPCVHHSESIFLVI
jgi:hypothetical protein